jgi:hypothetical protein
MTLALIHVHEISWGRFAAKRGDRPFYAQGLTTPSVTLAAIYVHVWRDSSRSLSKRTPSLSKTGVVEEQQPWFQEDP